MALESTQPLTEMSTRNLPGGKERPVRKAHSFAAILWADCLDKMWEPRRLTALSASTACYRGSFTIFRMDGVQKHSNLRIIVVDLKWTVSVGTWWHAVWQRFTDVSRRHNFSLPRYKNNLNLATLFGCQYSVLLWKGIQRDEFMSINIRYSITHAVYDRTQGNLCHVSVSRHFCFVRILSRYSVYTVYVAGIKCWRYRICPVKRFTTLLL
jgi:hypothetical protein